MSNVDSENFGFTIADVARLLRWRFDRKSQGLGLSRAQWSVLAHLYRSDGIRQNELANMLEVKPITIARQLDRLETNSWIERRNDPNDRRAKRVFLTAKAKPMISRLSKIGRSVLDEAMNGVSPEDQEKFVETLLLIRANLTKSD